MDEAARTALSADLESGETLRWAGRPGALPLAAKQSVGVVFFLIWIGFVCTGFIARLAASGHWLNLGTLVSLLFLAAALAGLAFSINALTGLWRTFYGITDRRILVVKRQIRRRVTSWTQQQITAVERRDRANGRGDVVFHQSLRPSVDGSELVSATLTDVADARTVEPLVRRLAAAPRR